MRFPLHVTFRDIDATPSLERYVAHRAEKLDRFYDRIERCDVLVERSHQHHQRLRVRVVLAVPGNDVVVTQAPELDDVRDHPYAAIRDAFRAVRRRLQDHTRKLRGDIKMKTARARAVVA